MHGTHNPPLPPAQVLESEACGVAAAPIGLCNMLNAGGAVLAAELAGEPRSVLVRRGRGGVMHVGKNMSSPRCGAS